MGGEANCESVMMAPPDAQAVGHPDDVVGWLERLRPALRSFLLRKLRDPGDINDALQEVNLRVFHYATRTPVRAPVSLCFRVAGRVAIDFARNHGPASWSRPLQYEEVEDQLADPCSPERTVSAYQQLKLVKETIRGLPPGCRHVFLLSRSNGLTNVQIAERCGISVKMVEKQISRALHALRLRTDRMKGEPA